jgi:all-trans-retinol dehydrogenase (NAD+)
MAFRNRLLPREGEDHLSCCQHTLICCVQGFTLDTVQTLVEKTLLNPAVTLPLYLLWQYKTESQFARLEVASKIFLFAGAAKWINAFLNDGFLNNWKSDIYDWSKELVLITGGSNGIGKALAEQFAQKKIKVIILDIETPKTRQPDSLTNENSS